MRCGLEAEEGKLLAKFAIKDAAMLFAGCKVACMGLRVEVMCVHFEPSEALEEQVGYWM